MATDDEASAIIDRIYDVAVDPARYEAMLDVWERRLSVLRLRADADKQNRVVEMGIEAHLDRAEIFLQRLTDIKTGSDRSALDIDVKASFLVGTHLLIDQVNRAAQEVFQLRVGDSLARLPLDPDDASVLIAAIRAVLATRDGPPTLMRFTSARSDRSIIFHIARQPKVDGQASLVLVRTTELGWPEQLSRTMRDAFSLTASEVEIVRALAEGKSLRAIAVERKRSFDTVRTQTSTILAKTGTHSQAELIRITLGLMDVVGTEAELDPVHGAAQALAPIPFQSLRMSDGRRYDWIEFGDPGGRACLFLPIDYGMIRWPRAAEIAARRHKIRVVVPVRAGFGHSTPQPRGVKNYAAATGTDLRALLDHLGIRRCVVLALGADFRFALALAACAPQRLTGIYGCSAALPVLNAKQYERMGKWHRFILANARYAPQILPFLVKAGFALARRIGKDNFFRSVHAGSPADIRVFADPEIRAAILLGSDICLGPSHSAHEAFARECIDSEADWSDLLASCPVPVRLLQGAEDQQTPAETVREVMLQFPALDIEIVEDAGTLIFFQHWPRILRELEPMLPAKGV